jgi:hypothetical protein
MTPSFPSERKWVEGARTGLLTYAFPATFPQARPRGLAVQWFTRASAMAKVPGWFPALAYTTGRGAGALTVAGQWRSFTAFPSILAIAVVSCAALFEGSRNAWNRFPCHQCL